MHSRAKRVKCGPMHLKCRTRRKDGKTHRSYSIVESRREGRRVYHKHVLHLGEISDAQRQSWENAIGVFDEGENRMRQFKLFAAERELSTEETDRLQVKLSALSVRRPRQWGACWLADRLWHELHLDAFFREQLGATREGTEWEKVLRGLAIYRLLSPGSEWRYHRHWYETTALGDLLGAGEAYAQSATLYRCHDRLLAHKESLFAHLRERWENLFEARYDILLYDLTSTYFECDVPEDETDPRRFGYSRDRRSDCVQVVIALVVTPEGLPLAYEMLPGNTSDKTTLADMLALVEKRHGAARRVWVMDRGIPTEAALQAMRVSDPPIHYLVGTPKSRLSAYESRLAEQPWREVKGQLRVKSVNENGETYVYTESPARVDKERSMRRRALKTHWKRLHELSTLKRPLSRDEMLLRLGKAQEKAGRLAASLVETEVTPEGRLVYRLNKCKLREVRRREGRYLLRTNLENHDPDVLWRYYMQLVFVEEAFRTLKGDLSIRPVYHQLPQRIEAHLFIAFLAYCLSITLRQRLKAHAPGLMPRVVFEKLSTLQMLDVHIPVNTGAELILTRHSEPDEQTALLLDKLDLKLPNQPPPRIRYPETSQNTM
jgi:transposase